MVLCVSFRQFQGTPLCSLILFHQDELSQDLLNFAAESLRDGGRLVFLAGRPVIAKQCQAMKNLIDIFIFMMNYILLDIIGLLDLARSLSFDFVWPQHHNISFLAFWQKGSSGLGRFPGH